MKIRCPSCQAAYDMDENRVPESGVNIRCPRCSSPFRVGKTGVIDSLRPREGGPVPLPSSQPPPPRQAGAPTAPGGARVPLPSAGPPPRQQPAPPRTAAQTQPPQAPPSAPAPSAPPTPPAPQPPPNVAANPQRVPLPDAGMPGMPPAPAPHAPLVPPAPPAPPQHPESQHPAQQPPAPQPGARAAASPADLGLPPGWGQGNHPEAMARGAAVFSEQEQDQNPGPDLSAQPAPAQGQALPLPGIGDPKASGLPPPPLGTRPAPPTMPPPAFGFDDSKTGRVGASFEEQLGGDFGGDFEGFDESGAAEGGEASGFDSGSPDSGAPHSRAPDAASLDFESFDSDSIAFEDEPAAPPPPSQAPPPLGGDASWEGASFEVEGFEQDAGEGAPVGGGLQGAAARAAPAPAAFQEPAASGFELGLDDSDDLALGAAAASADDPFDVVLDEEPPAAQAPAANPFLQSVAFAAKGPTSSDDLSIFQEGQEERWLVRRPNGKVIGPFVAKSLVGMLREGQLSGNEDISADGKSWEPLHLQPVLAQALPKREPPGLAARGGGRVPPPVIPVMGGNAPTELDAEEDEEEEAPQKERSKRRWSLFGGRGKKRGKSAGDAAGEESAAEGDSSPGSPGAEPSLELESEDDGAEAESAGRGFFARRKAKKKRGAAPKGSAAHEADDSGALLPGGTSQFSPADEDSAPGAKKSRKAKKAKKSSAKKSKSGTEKKGLFGIFSRSAADDEGSASASPDDDSDSSAGSGTARLFTGSSKPGRVGSGAEPAGAIPVLSADQNVSLEDSENEEEPGSKGKKRRKKKAAKKPAQKRSGGKSKSPAKAALVAGVLVVAAVGALVAFGPSLGLPSFGSLLGSKKKGSPQRGAASARLADFDSLVQEGTAGGWKKSLSAAQKAIELDPTHDGAHARFALSAAVVQRRYARGKEELDLSRANLASGLPSSRKERELAQAALSLSSKSPAANKAEALVKAWPGDVGVLALATELLLAGGKPKQAQALLQQSELKSAEEMLLDVRVAAALDKAALKALAEASDTDSDAESDADSDADSDSGTDSGSDSSSKASAGSETKRAESGAADPGAADPGAADPEARDSELEDSKTADSKTADPKASDPKTTGSKTADSKTNDPKIVDPTEPEILDHAAGALQQAALTRMLAVYPEHPEALLAQAMLFLSNGHSEKAAELFQQLVHAPEGGDGALSLKLDIADEARIFRALGDIHQDRRELDEAVEAYQHAVSKDSGSVSNRMALASLYMYLHKWSQALENYEKALEIKRSPELWAGKIRALVELESNVKAQETLEEALKDSSKHPAVVVAAGFLKHRVGQLEEAREHFAQALEQEPDYVDALVADGRVLLEQKKTDEASERASQAVKLAPERADVLVLYGQVLFRTKKHSEARKAFEKALEHDERSAEAMLGLGLALDQLGLVEEAITTLKASVAADPGNVDALWELAKVLHREEHSEEALEYLEAAIEQAPENARLFSLKGSILVLLGQYEAADEALRRALRDDSDAMAHEFYGRLRGLTGNPNRAVEHLRRASQLNPESPEPHYYRGLVLFQSNQMLEAELALNEALEIDPQHLDARELMGMSYARRSFHAAAIKELEQVLKAEPERGSTLEALGEALVGNHQAEQALPVLKKALSLSPEKLEIHYLLGRAHNQLGSLRDAARHYVEASKADSADAKTWYYLGYVYKEQNKGQEAISAFRRYLELEPEAVEKTQLEDDIFYLERELKSQKR